MEKKPQESLQHLLDVCLMLSSKLELSELLTSIMELSSRVVGSETASLFLLDDKSQELYFHVALGLDPETAKMRLKLGQGIAGTAAQEQKPLIINDAPTDPRWIPTVDRKSGFKTRSILAVPMTIKDRLIGVVEAINKKEGSFDYRDLKVFQAFASQAAIAIDNARLFESLRAEKAKLDTVYARMKEAAVLTDETGRVLLSNEAARAHFASGEAAGRTLAEQMSAFATAPPLTGILASKEPVVHFEATRDQPKKLVFAGTASYLHVEATGSTPGWSGRLFVFRDVTEAKQEEMLKRSFLSLISHKLRTPLAAITGYAQLLMEDAEPRLPPEAAKQVGTILGQGKKLAELVDQLLRFTTMQDLSAAGLQCRPFDVGEAIAQAVRSLQGWLAERSASVLFKPGPGHTAYGDPQLIRQVVVNLVENGVKFNPKPEKEVSVWTEIADGFVSVHVRDEGPGIPPEELERVFSQFYQSEAFFTGQVEGWGLGLPFVKKVVEQHGGKVRLESRLGQGTTVSFTVPVPPPGP